MKCQVVETYISALPFFSDKVKAVNTAREIVEAYGLDNLQLVLALREQKLSRLNLGNSQIRSSLNVVPSDLATNVEFGEVIISRAYDLIKENHCDKALAELQRVQPYGPRPTKREQLLRQRADLAAGIAHRNLGEFDQGLSVLKRLWLEAAREQAHTTAGNSVICHLGALYIELSTPIEAIVLLEDQKLVLESWDWQHDRRGRQNLVYLAAAYLHLDPGQATGHNHQELRNILKRRGNSFRALDKISPELQDLCQGHGNLQEAIDSPSHKIYTRVKCPWTAAEEICRDLRTAWKISSDTDLASKMLYLQLLTIDIRISLLQGRPADALSCCEQALEIAGRCSWPEGYFEMEIYRTISQIKLILGEPKDSEAFENRARELYISHPPRFWIVGFGTFWRKFLQISASRPGTPIEIRWKECLEPFN
jgi:tetratricopeptide (TPR) repeat protein